MKSFKEVERIDSVCEGMYQDLEITEAEYQGKKVKLLLAYLLSVIILLEENLFVQDIIVIIQDQRQRPDTGHAINGVLTLQSITNTS